MFSSSSFKRLDGQSPGGPIDFLPIGVGVELARRWGLIATSDWRACYELSGDVLNPDPRICSKSLQEIAQDVVDGAEAHGHPGL